VVFYIRFKSSENFKIDTCLVVGGIQGVTAELIVSHGMSDFPILLAMLML
jgi:hypothetical protein